MSVTNIEKIIQYLIPVSKENIEIDGNIVESHINQIVLTKRFFSIDGCNMCGHCCPPEHNTYVQFEYDAIMEFERDGLEKLGLPVENIDDLRENLKTFEHIINGKVVKLYEFRKKYPLLYLPRKGKEVKRCYWVHKFDDGRIGCGIYPLRSLTCRMPHMRFYYNNRTGHSVISTREFGRNWALGCEMEFKQPETEQEFIISKKDRIEKLKYLQKVADELNVDTYVPEIIKYVEAIPFRGYEFCLKRNILEPVPKKLIVRSI